MVETILQHPILTGFVYPFLLVFFIVFAVLEKTRLFGEDRRQLNALLAFVIGLVFISAVSPKLIVSNMILFLSVALVIMFVILLLWGFLFASSDKGFELTKGMKGGLAIVFGIAIIVAIFWATGATSGVFDALFNQSWSEAFWTNLIFIILIGLAIALIIKSKPLGSS